MDRSVGDQGGSSSNMFRDYRKGNWTVKETMVLIEAKKMDDERRMRRQEGKPTELRWKWVEDYCWRNGCLRSQNQCNDKWDNLMRDFKKVREYERGVVEGTKSYWRIEKNERKEKNLPTNMLLEIYEALVDVVDRKSQRMLLPPLQQQQQQSTQPQITPLSFSQQQPVPPLPLPAATTTVAQTDYTTHVPFTTTMCDSSDGDDHSSEHSDSAAKKRRMSGGGGGGEGTSTGTSKGNMNKLNSSQEVGIAISKSAAIIAETIQSCKERQDIRHKELLTLHHRRLQIEESKAEINRQGINGLVDSINKLANSILALAGNKNQSTDPK